MYTKKRGGIEMRIVVKGLNYTEVRYLKKNCFTETVQHWVLQKPRKEKDCGVWVDGVQHRNFENMVIPMKIDKKTLEVYG